MAEARPPSTEEYLAAGFFEPDFDPVAHIFERMPTDDDVALSAFWMNEATTADVAQDTILSKLSKSVLGNYESFIGGMRQVQEIDLDMTRAGVCLSNMLRHLQTVKKRLVTEPLVDVVQQRRRRERLAAVVAKLRWIRAVTGVELQVRWLVGQGAFGRAAATVTATEASFRARRSEGYKVLRCINNRLQNTVRVLRAAIDQSLASCCNEFDPSTYARTLVGCFMLDAHASKGGIGGYGLIQDDEEEEGVGGTPGVGRGRGGEGEPGCIAGLAFRLQSFLLETIKTKSQDAIIDVLMLRDEALPANTSEQSKAAPSRARAGTATDEAAAVVTDEAMRERYRLKSFSELCGRVPSEYLPVATARVCEAVAEVMHTHFLLLQWHRAPFHSQHNDPEWLHRSLPGGDDALADFDDDSDGGPESGGVLDQDYVVDLDSHLAVPGESAAAAGESSTEGGREGVSSPKPIASTAASRAAAAHRLLQVDQVMETVQLKGLQWRDALQAVRPALLHSRRVIWQHVQQRVAGLLFDACTSMRSELSVPSLLACLAICQRLMVVGQAYSEEPSHNLKGALQLLCRQQMDQVHRKAFDGLRTMLSRETWRRIPVPLEQLGGIRGLVMRSAGTRAGMAAVASVQVRTAAAIATGAMDATPGRDYQDAASGMVGARTLHVWHVEGNPLKSVLDVLQLQTFELNEHGLPRCLAAQLAAADAAPDDGVDANSDAESDAAPNTPGGHGSDGSGSDEEPQQGVLAVLGGASGVKSSFRQDHPYVVTMSALNGFAKHVSKYLQLMEFLSSVSMDAFIGLQKLFELYLYTVATQFFSVAAMKFLFTEYAIVGVPEPAPTTNPSGTGVAAGGGAASPAAPVDAFAGAKGAGTGKTPSDQLPQTPTAVCLFQELEPDSFDFKDKAPLAVAHMITPLLLPADHHTKSGRRRRTARDKSCGALEALNAAYARTSAATFPYESLRLTLLRTKFENETGQRFSTDSDLLAAVEVEGVDTANPRSLPQPFVALTPEVKLGASNNHAVVERCVSVESLLFMFDILCAFRDKIAHCIPPSEASSVSRFYDRAADAILQLRAYTYNSIVPKVMPQCGSIPRWVPAACRWEQQLEVIDANEYTRDLQKCFHATGESLKAQVAAGDLPEASYAAVWSCIVSHVFDRLVEGFSRIRRCSNEGRGLMLLDSNIVFNAAKAAGPVSADILPRTNTFLDGYVQAFYLREEGDVMGWIVQNTTTYHVRHMRALLEHGLGQTMKKKQLKDLVTKVEAMYLD